jgi:hypothetical protein
MRHLKVPLLTVFATLFLSITFGQTSSAPTAGDGTVGNPYQIATLENFYWLSQTSSEWVAGKYFIQTADIDASATSTWFDNGAGGYYGFPCIGGNSNIVGNQVLGAFRGNYNGQGFSISDIYINRSPNQVAIFGRCIAATIQNLRIVNPVVISGGSGNDAAILIARNQLASPTILTNVHIIGGSLTSSNLYIGTMLGSGVAAATNCTTSATVNQSAGGTYVGGFVGYMSGSSSYSNCGASGNVNTTSNYAGGFAGYIIGLAQISRCFSKGNVTGNNVVGGFAGVADPSGGTFFEDCYATGNVTNNTNTYAGGFLGDIPDANSASINFIRCYAKGSVTGTSTGGFGGYSPYAVYTDCFWDYESSTQGFAFFDGYNPNVYGKTTLEMKNEYTFTNWDFVTAPKWKINSTDNDGYPYLAWEPFPPTITSFTPTSAIAGATVTITGTNFGGTTAVSFGGTDASSFTVVDATTITAVVGTGATGVVRVTNADGVATKAGFILGKIWTGAASQYWNNTANWSPASLPEAGAAILFSLTAATDLYADNNYTVSSIDFNGSGRMLYLQNYTLNAGSIIGATATGYIKSDNATSSIKMNVANGATVVFPVGNSSYNPVSITNNSGMADDFSVNIVDEVYSQGTTGAAMTTNRVQRTWNISKTNPNAGAGIDFVFNWSSGTDVVGVLSSANLFHYGTSWVKQTGTTVSTSTSLTYTGYTGTFSPFSIMEGSSTLPVSWLSFTAQKQNKAVVLNWSTATEQNTENFTVQHSVNGRDWKSVATKAAAGNSNTVQQYTYTHTTPIAAVNYYRLIQRDLDGKETFSKVVSMNWNGLNKQLSIYPNPVVNGRLHVQLEKAAMLQVFNNIGAVVLQKQLQAGVHSLSMETLAKGIYRIKAGDETIQFVIQ